MKKYRIHYYNASLILPYQAIEVKTENISAWEKQFTKNGNIAVLEIDIL